MQGLFVASQEQFGGLDGGGPVGDRESASIRFRPQYNLIFGIGKDRSVGIAKDWLVGIAKDWLVGQRRELLPCAT